jgi:hypothetical protein
LVQVPQAVLDSADYRQHDAERALSSMALSTRGRPSTDICQLADVPAREPADDWVTSPGSRPGAGHEEEKAMSYTDSDTNDAMQLPQPDPALEALEFLVGTWSIEGNLVGSDEKAIKGQATFQWLPGRFFLEQRITLNFMGMEIKSLELIGYDSQAGSLVSTVYGNLAPAPLPYKWDVQGQSVTINVDHGPLNATYQGVYRNDGTFAGGWRPNPGADETVNVPYDISGHRLG